MKKTPKGASHGLTEDGGLVEDSNYWVGAALLQTDEQERPLVQLKVWTRKNGWTHIVLDADHNLVAFTGLYGPEGDGFEAMEEVLKNKRLVS